MFDLAVDFLRFTPDNNLLFVVGRNLVVFNADDNSEKVIKQFKSRITCAHVDGDLLIIGGEPR